MLDVRLLSRRKDGIQNIEIIKWTFPYKIKACERTNRDESNDAICMLIKLVVVKLLSEVWWLINVRFWWGAGLLSIS
jgi:hypothetical protein